MKLEIIFNREEKPQIIYEFDGVILYARNIDDVAMLLNDEKSKMENLANCEEEISYESLIGDEILSPEFIDTDYNSNSSIINKLNQKKENIKKAKEKSFEIDSFLWVNITFESLVDFKEYQFFLESLKHGLTLDFSDISYDNFKILKTFKFMKEPEIRYKFNKVDVLFSDFMETQEIIEEEKELIKQYNFSKLDQLMLLYDLLKERLYKNNSEGKSYVSRDLNQVLKSEEIVCLGYARIFAAVANSLEIPTHVKYYYPISDEKEYGHATAISFINDEISSFTGCLEFDMTWDRKKTPNSKKWINNYDWFGLNEELAEKAKKIADLEPYKSDYSFSQITNLFKKYQKDIQNNLPEIIIENKVKKIINQIIKIYEFLNLDFESDFLKELLSQIDNKEISPMDTSIIEKIVLDIKKHFQNSISVDLFIETLYRVRRVEHNINPAKYSLEYNQIKTIANKRFAREKIAQKVLEENTYKPVLESMKVMPNISKSIVKNISCDAKRMELLFLLRQREQIKNRESGLTKK